MYRNRVWIIAVVLWMSVCTYAEAETMYVTDILQVTVRTGMGKGRRILKIMKSNEKVDVLATEGEYAKIKLNDDMEGWMLKRYLTTAIPKPTVIADLEGRLEKLKNSRSVLSEKLSKLRDEKKELKKTEDENEKKLSLLETQYEDLKLSSADYLKLKSEHEKLRRDMERKEQKTQNIMQQNSELRKKSNLMWFVAGSFAVLIGFIIGLVLQNLRYRRKRQISF